MPSSVKWLCQTTIVTMKSHIQALEERANAAIVQSTVFGQIAAEAVPKSLHCLNVKLMSDWLKMPSLQEFSDERKNSPRLVDNNLYHFCIFSDNILAPVTENMNLKIAVTVV